MKETFASIIPMFLKVASECIRLTLMGKNTTYNSLSKIGGLLIMEVFIVIPQAN